MAVTDNSGTEMHAYSYDNIYQVTGVDYPAGYDPDLATDTTFSYDDAGNRTSVIDAGGISSYVTNALNQYTAVGGVSYDYDSNGNLTQDDRFQYAYDPENRLLSATKLAGTPDPLTAACDSTLVFTTGGSANWSSQTNTYHDGGDAAQSGDIADGQESWMETTFEGEGTLTFYWTVSSESGSDYLKLFIDGNYNTSICGSQSWQLVSRTIVGLGTHTIRWVYDKDDAGSAGSDCGWVDNVQWTAANNSPVAALAAAVDNANLGFITGGHADWDSTTLQPYYDGDCTRSGYIANGQKSEMQTTISGSGTLTFYWKISGDDYSDKLEFFVDGVSQGFINQWQAWAVKEVAVSGAGNHTLLWRYTEGGTSSYAYVDYVQWTGAGPLPPPEPEWQAVSYTYDPSGRRVEKKVDGTTQVKYVYDGDHILAEYNNAGTLLRKYVHGPGIDQPICMIEASGTYAGTHYYHYDALGSVVAMTNSSGNVVELYEYSVYGQVAASDENHPNRFMFTGREFDKDTGLYYYRARYYNPEIGRFLQTDPIGYGDGMNLYRYCRNNPLKWIDPTGLRAAPTLVAYGINITMAETQAVDPWETKVPMTISSPVEIQKIAFYRGFQDFSFDYDFVVVVEGDLAPRALSTFMSALNNLAHLPSGWTLLSEFAGKRSHTTVKMLSSSKFDQVPNGAAAATDSTTKSIMWNYYQWGGPTYWEGDDLVVVSNTGYALAQPSIIFAHELMHSWEDRHLGSSPESGVLSWEDTLRREWRDRIGVETCIWDNGSLTAPKRWSVPVPMLPEERADYGCL